MTARTRFGAVGVLVLSIGWIALASAGWLGCGDGVDAVDATAPSNDGGGSDGRVVSGMCKDVTCPKGNYCDEMTGGCRHGCLEDGDCASGYICNVSARTCTGGGGDVDHVDIGHPDGGKPDASQPDGGNDGGPVPKSVIIPGEGADYKPDARTTHQFRVGQSDYTVMTSALGAGTPDQNLKWYISWAPTPIDALFVDTSDDTNLNSGDLLNRLILLDGFNGATAAGHGIGTPKAAWGSEMGNAEFTTPLGTGDTADYFFTKGLNIVYDSTGNAKGLTVYKPTKVVPGQTIDWNNMSVFGITSSITNGSSFTEVEGALGTPDVITHASSSSVDTETYSYVALGLSFAHGTQAQTDVNTIVVYPPYFGKLSGTSLGIGSTHADIKAYFDAKHAEQSMPAGQGMLYYYAIKQETVAIYTFTITLGFVYNSTDQVASILVGYPIQN